VGKRFAKSVRRKLVSLGGYDSFADSMTVIDTILGYSLPLPVKREEQKDFVDCDIIENI
jgi:hypothetical protein